MKELALRFFKSILSQKKTLLGLVILIPLLSMTLVSFAYAISPLDLLCNVQPSLCLLSKLPGISGIGGGIVKAFIEGASALLDGIIGTIAVVVKSMAETVAGAMQDAVKFFIDIPVSPSNAKTPQTIKDGFDTTRQIVNIVFILILTFIGLATILRLQTYQLQKTLPSLIIMALLVNFSGVFVGFVVDIGNIFTKAFINAGESLKVWSVADIPLIPFGGGAAKLGTHIVEIIYYLISTLVYFVVVLLFGVRTLILWTLSILAPIAFAAYILPGTKKYWSQWLQTLIQWSILGIPIAFTLYLAKTVMLAGPSGFGGLLDPASSLFKLAAPFTALFLLFLGITLSMQLAPAGASAVISKGKEWGIGIGKGLGSAVARRVPLGRFGENIRKRGQGIEVSEAEKTRLERWGGRVLGKIPGMGRIGSAINVPMLEKQRGSIQTRIDELEAKRKRNHGKLGAKDAAELGEKKTELENVNAQISTASRGTVTQGVARFARRGATLFGGGLEMAGKELDMRMGTKDEREVAVGTKDVGNKDSFQVFNMVNEELAKGPLASWNRIVGMLNGIRNRGDGDDIRDALRSGQLNKKVIGGVIKNGRRVGPPGFRPLLKSFYGKIYADSRAYGFDADVDEQGNVIEGSGKDAMFLAAQKQSLPSKFNAQDFQGDTIDPDSFDPNTKEGRLFLDMILKGRGADFMSQLGRRPRKEESRAIMEYIFKEGGHAKTGLGINWLLDNDAEDVLRYLDSPGARSLGLGRNIGRQEIERLIAQKQQGQTPSDLYDQQVRLEEERREQEELSQDQALSKEQQKNARARVRQINKRIQRVEAALNLMNEDATPTQRLLDDVARLQNDITKATQTIEQDASNLQAYRSRAAAERESRPLQQELGRRGVSIPTTPQEQNYGQLLERRTQLQAQRQNQEQQLQQELVRIAPQEPHRQQLLQEIENAQREMQAPSLHPDYIANLQQQVSLAQQELAGIEGERRRLEDQIKQTTQQIGQTEQRIGNVEVELGQIPERPAPLPKIQPNMPGNVQKLINQGNEAIQEIDERTKEIQGYIADMRGLREGLTDATGATARLNEELHGLTIQEQSGTLAPERLQQVQTKQTEIQGELQRVQNEETALTQQISTAQNNAVRAREAILKSKERVDGDNGIRQHIKTQNKPLQRKYESAQRDRQRDQRLKQMQKRREKKS